MNLRMRKRQEAFSPPARGIWTLLALMESPVVGGRCVKGKEPTGALHKTDGGPGEDGPRKLN